MLEYIWKQISIICKETLTSDNHENISKNRMIFDMLQGDNIALYKMFN